MLMDNILHNLLTQTKDSRETEQNNNNKSDLIQNKEPTCRLNWSEKRSRNKRSQIFSLPLFACDCYDFFYSLAFDGSVFSLVVAVCDDLNQKLWECIIQNVLNQYLLTYLYVFI